jgi:hypothetical protein
MNVRLEHGMSWTAAIWFDGRQQMNNYTVELALVTNSSVQQDHTVSLHRLNHFVYHELANTTFIHQDDGEQMAVLTQAGIKITTLPEIPIDQIIGIGLYCKLNAILQDKMIVTSIKIQSDLGDNVWYLHNDQESVGPFGQPGWWQDATPVHTNYQAINKKKDVVKLNLNTTWHSIGLEWDDVEPMDTDNNTVVFAKFGPDEN